jgi:hypothetical protein
LAFALIRAAAAGLSLPLFSSYIVHEAEGERFSAANHPQQMDADHAASYLVERLLRDEMP